MTNNEILNSETTRTKGIDALNSNIEAGRAVANIIKSTLGPMGMDKMLIDETGETTITNDGAKILKEMQLEHPGAKILVEIAKTQETEIGDGTTSAVIIAGELLKEAQKLLEQKIHQTTIIRGYKLASKKALEILDKLAIPIEPTQTKVLKDICSTAMTGKLADLSKDKLIELLIDITQLLATNEGLPRNKLKIVKISGQEINNSEIIKGIVLDKEPTNPNVPNKIQNPKILLIDFPLETKELDNDAKINLNSVEEYQQFLNQETKYLDELYENIKNIGCNVVISQKGIDDQISYNLAKEGIICIRRTNRNDLEKLSYALNTKIVSTTQDIKRENLGKAKILEIKEINDEKYIFISGCENPKAITLVLKASTKHIIDEIERAIDDAIGDINSILKNKFVVGGGGAVECELNKELNHFSKTFTGKEQIVIKHYAESFLSIPKTLCENCGMDEIENITTLISMHEKGQKMSGINGFKGIVEDTIKHGIVEPKALKEQIIKSATESSCMILRIDDIIAAKKIEHREEEIR